MMGRLLAVFSALLGFAVAAVGAERSTEISLIPWPASFEPANGSLTIDAQTQVVFDGGAGVREVAHYFGDLLRQSRGLRPVIVQGTAQDAPKRAVVFALAPGGANPEAYRLEVSSKGAVLTASDPRGLFNGAVTLWQLATLDSADAAEVRVPAARISDAPRLRWRGLLLDSARQYQSVDFIKRYLDFMALHKLNVLHWHLVDDHAWRLQVPKFPKLTGGLSSYSAAEVREVVTHAATRNITVVPGLEMPGHATAAATAYPSLRAADSPTNDTYLYNVEEETFAFFDAVISEVAALFPGEFIHIGAGEAPYEQWQQSSSVQARMRELGIINEFRLQRYFFERITALVARHQRRIVGWDGLLIGGVPGNSVVMTAKGLDGALTAAASGHEVVVSSGSGLSLNLPQSTVASERDSAGDILSLGDVYRFDPAPTVLSAQDRSRLIGVQANVWTRTDGNEQDIEAMTFPRAAALAEIAWTPAVQLRWAPFQRRMVAMLGRYSRLGIRYSDAAFRAMVFNRGENGDRVSIELAKQVPLGEIRYTLNGSEPTAKSAVYTDVFEAPRSMTLKAAVFYNGEPLTQATAIDLNTGALGQ